MATESTGDRDAKSGFRGLKNAFLEFLTGRDRQVFQSADLPDPVLELIAQAEVPAEYAHLKDWMQ